MVIAQQSSESMPGKYSPSRWQTLAEIVLVLGVFVLEGAWPVPEVNEPYYLTKAIHYWNPGWLAGDYFLQTADTHRVFYFAVGWLSWWLSPTALAWVARFATWFLLAWGWQRLSTAIVPRRWWAVLTAALVVLLNRRLNMAGEWLVGGVEGKGFAYALVLFGLAAMVRGRWNRAWLFFGAASAFHVLVGGWAAVAAGGVWLVAWIADRRTLVSSGTCANIDSGFRQVGQPAPRLVQMLWGLLGGLVLALPGLVPVLVMNLHASAAADRQAAMIHVFQRLQHHLDPWQFPPQFVGLFAVLATIGLLLWRATAEDPARRRLATFMATSLVIASLGGAISLLGFVDRGLEARLLRFYWFRLADVAMPVAVALLGPAWIDSLAARRPAARRWWLAAIVSLASLHLVDCVALRAFAPPRAVDRYCVPEAWENAWLWATGQGDMRPFAVVPRADRLPEYDAWREACRWIATSGRVPDDAVFLTPHGAQTFKWYANRAEVATWKDVPQDAAAVVVWRARMQDLFGTGKRPPDPQWQASLTEQGAARLRELAHRYGATYVLTNVTYPLLDLPVAHKNNAYVVYRVR
jgi:hypothetical protein